MVSASAAHDYRVHTTALAQAMTDATRRQRTRTITRRTGPAFVPIPKREQAKRSEAPAPVLSTAELDFMRRSARAQQEDAHETLHRAREMSTANEEMRARVQTMAQRIAAQTDRRGGDSDIGT